MQNGLQDNKANKENWVYLIKIVACILITNSHCRDIYPYYFLAIGGGFGNALFLALSGYLLVNIKDAFGTWYRKRIGRLIWSFLLIVLVDMVFISGVYRPGYYLDKYWFVTAIIIYYVLYYFTFNNFKPKRFVAAFIVWVLGYIFMYLKYLDLSSFSVEKENFSPFKVYFYFGVMLVGGIIGRYKEYIKIKVNECASLRVLLGGMCVISAVAWATIYAFIVVCNTLYMFQFLIQVSVLVFAVSVILLLMGLEWKVPRIGKIVADSTLEIYLVQIAFGYISLRTDFPLSWIVFWSIALIGGMLVNLFVHKIKNVIKVR